MIRVKICGVMTIADARACAEAGVDMIGLNFYMKSPRFIDVEAARVLCAALRAEYGPACPLFVGVFVNAVVGTISRTMEQVGLNFAQMSGDESVEMLREMRGIAYKAIRPRGAREAADDVGYFAPGFPVDARMPSLLIDAAHDSLYGGTGAGAVDEAVRTVIAAVPRVMLAGGLTPDNVAARVAAFSPWGVDVASGVEAGTPGVKDHDKIRAFTRAVRSV
jgi:phosphoribosylanthranilate isomerase